MSTRLPGAVALITGAASGIARASALMLAAEGVRVAVADIDAARAGATVAEITAAGGAATAFPVDLAVVL